MLIRFLPERLLHSEPKVELKCYKVSSLCKKVNILTKKTHHCSLKPNPCIFLCLILNLLLPLFFHDQDLRQVCLNVLQMNTMNEETKRKNEKNELRLLRAVQIKTKDTCSSCLCPTLTTYNYFSQCSYYMKQQRASVNLMPVCSFHRGKVNTGKMITWKYSPFICSVNKCRKTYSPDGTLHYGNLATVPFAISMLYGCINMITNGSNKKTQENKPNFFFYNPSFSEGGA